MTESVGAAEALDLRASAYFLWQAPGKPVSVHLSLDVVDRLEKEVIESFKAITKRGSEIGGLLLGKVAAAGQPTVIVEEYEAVPCEYSRGPLYLLADDDKGRLLTAIQRTKTGPGKGLSVVGYFRSNTRKDLALDDDDQALLAEYFGDPAMVCLLVKPFSMKPSLAGFFFWEEGQMRGEASHLQFPFKRSELSKGDFAKAIVSGGQVMATAAPAAAPPRVDGGPAPPAPPKLEARAPAPPVIAKREEPPPPPPPPPKLEARAPAPPVIPKREEPPPPPPPPPKLEARAPAPPVIPKREQPAPPPPPPPKPEVRPAAPPATAKREEPPAPKPEVRPAAPPATAKREEPTPPRAAKPEAVAPAPPVLPKREEPAAAPVAVPAPPAAESRSRKLPYAIAAALAVVLIGSGAYLYLGRGGQKGAGVAAGPEAGSLALRVERNAGQLLLSWNREASAVKMAQRAVLSISDGDRKEGIELDPAQLRSGSIVYSPITNDVSFRLEVIDTKQAKFSESVRVIAGRPSPAAPLGQAAPARSETQPAETRPRQEPALPPQAASRTPEPAAGPAPTPGGGADPPAPAPAKPVTQAAAPASTESLAARLSPPPNLPEPPKIEGQPSPAAVRPVETPGGTPPPPPTQVPEPTPQTTQAPAEQPPIPAPTEPVRVGGNVQQAKVVRQVSPVYPPLARQARVAGVVRVEATIGKDGKVLKAAALNGPPLLRQAAADAVRQWIYRPTTLNNQPVEVVTQIDVTFNLNR